MGRSTRLGSLPFLLVLIAGVALRAWHLGTFGLWWDEIVHIWTSQSGGLTDVLLEVKRGIPPGAGNAGAVPLDYALLHLYLRATSPPAPESLEVYYRLPSFLYSVLALPLLYAFGRRFLDRQVALVATLLLALSLPHVLYAAEARFYSLFVLTTIANLYAFANLVERRERWGAWLAYGAVNVLYFFSGLFSLFVLLLQYAVLGALLARTAVRVRRGDGAERRRSLAFQASAYVVSGAVVAGCVALYLSGTALGHKYGRSVPDWMLDPLRVTWQTLASFSSDNPLLLGALLLLPVPLVYAWRRGILPVVAYLELSLLAIPLIVEMARWKRYYFHPRHALFLLPAMDVLTAVTLLFVLRALDPFRFVPWLRARREACNVALVCALVVATQAPLVRAYLATPERFFVRSKKTYDLKRITQDVRERVGSYGPRDKYLLVVQRNSMANTTLAQYLRWYGLEDRVVLRGTRDPAKTLRLLRRVCETRCLGERGPVLDRALELTGPVGLPPDFQRLLGLLKPIGYWPGTVREIGLVIYSPLPRDGVVDGFAQRRLRGVQLLTVAAPRAGGEARPEREAAAR
ncbi:MAG: glycosyltransferase family 39 protein [Thermodesulfobacteriota bacterium]